MRRREFFGLLGGAAAWHLTVFGEPVSNPTVGFLFAGTFSKDKGLLDTFRDALKQAGYVEGQNLKIEYREAEGQYARLPALAADLVSRKVEVIVAIGGILPAKAAKAAAAQIPIVFSSGGDPVKAGLVRSLNQPVVTSLGSASSSPNCRPSCWESCINLFQTRPWLAYSLIRHTRRSNSKSGN